MTEIPASLPTPSVNRYAGSGYSSIGRGFRFEHSWRFYPDGHNVVLILRADNEDEPAYLDVVNRSDVVLDHP